MYIVEAQVVTETHNAAVENLLFHGIFAMGIPSELCTAGVLDNPGQRVREAAKVIFEPSDDTCLETRHTTGFRYCM